MNRWVVYILLVFSNGLMARESKFINPLTDVCWECLFPMTVSGVNVTPKSKDQASYDTRFCICPGIPPKVGIPLTYWEPLYLVDVTHEPYKLLGLGGMKIGKSTLRHRGTVSQRPGSSQRESFYNVHFYTYPIFAMLQLFTDFACASKGELDVGYMSELDPLWNDEQLAAILNPEAGFFANNKAELACVADCAASSSGRPLDKLFWCAGCEGSLYPFTGTVSHHIGGIQASALLVHRVIAKLHRSYLMKGYDQNEFCQARTLPLIKKSLYKTQLLSPIPQTKGQCHPLGKSDMFWGAGKSYPYGGEEFIYLIWFKKQCCLDATKPLTAGGVYGG